MIDIALILGGSLPKEAIIASLKEAIEEYDIAKSDRAFHKICSMCILALTKEVMDGKSPKEMADAIADYEKTRAIISRLHEERTTS
jgi:hypothetical protein